MGSQLGQLSTQGFPAIFDDTRCQFFRCGYQKKKRPTRNWNLNLFQLVTSENSGLLGSKMLQAQVPTELWSCGCHLLSSLPIFASISLGGLEDTQKKATAGADKALSYWLDMLQNKEWNWTWKAREYSMFTQRAQEHNGFDGRWSSWQSPSRDARDTTGRAHGLDATAVQDERWSLVSSNVSKRSNGKPLTNGDLIVYKWWIFQPAMFDYRRVVKSHVTGPWCFSRSNMLKPHASWSKHCLFCPYKGMVINRTQ